MPAGDDTQAQRDARMQHGLQSRHGGPQRADERKLGPRRGLPVGIGALQPRSLVVLRALTLGPMLRLRPLRGTLTLRHPWLSRCGAAVAKHTASRRATFFKNSTFADQRSSAALKCKSAVSGGKIQS
jgi:hypothetical protein